MTVFGNDVVVPNDVSPDNWKKIAIVSLFLK